MAQVVVEMTGEEAKLWRAQQRILAQTKQLEKGYEKVGRGARQAGDTASRSLGDRLGAKIIGTTGAFLSLNAAIGAITGSLREVDQKAETAIQRMRGLGDQRRRLAQIADSPQDLQELESLADEIAKAEGIDRGQARRLLFSAQSAGVSRATVRQVAGASRIIDPDAAIRAATELPLVFGGKISPDESLNAVLAAARSSVLDVEGFLGKLPQAAQGGSLAGATPAETFAALGVLAGELGDSAADRLKAFGTKVGITPALEGQGFLGAVETLAALPEAERRKFLGESQELNVAFAKLQANMERIRAETDKINQEIRETGTPLSALAEAKELAFDPQTPVGRLNRAERDLARAEVANEIAQERQLAAKGLQTRTARERLGASLVDEGFTPLSTVFGDQVAKQAQGLGFGPVGVERAGRFAADPIQGVLDSGAPLLAFRGAVAAFDAILAKWGASADVQREAALEQQNAARAIQEVSLQFRQQAGAAAARAQAAMPAE